MSDRLDPQFRDKLGKIEVPYDPADWASLQARLDAPARRRRTLLWLALPAAALLLGTAAVLYWPERAGEQLAGSGQSLETPSAPDAERINQSGFSGEGSPAAGQVSTSEENTSALNDQPDAVAQRADQTGRADRAQRAGLAGRTVSGKRIERENISSAYSTSAAYEASAAYVASAADGAAGQDASVNKTAMRAAATSQLAGKEEEAAAAVKTAETAAKVAEREKYFPRPVDPMAAVSDPTGPSDREWEQDPTLKRGPRLLDVALMGSVGLNAEYTGADDGFRPGQDVGVGAELWFRSGVFLSAGVFYGQYHFHQNQVACGNPLNYGIKEPVHCPDALLGTRGRWEIPMQVGYGWELARARGRFRVAAGLTGQRVREEDYDVEFHNAQPGVLLFYEPVTIALTESAPENLSFDAYGLVESSNQYTVQPVGPSERVANTKVNAAAELSLGYEQFLAPSFSLGVEPRIGVPFRTLPISEGRAYYGGVAARLRWYPGLAGR